MPYVTRRGEGGFTLVELIIVIAIIAIIASMSIPSLVRSRLSANESSAIATLRTVATVQAQVRNRSFIDLDSDGAGEYAFFGELSGTVAPRNNAGNPLAPPLLSGTFTQIVQGAAARAGYVYKVYLPDAQGNGLDEAAANYPLVDSDTAEVVWCCYAWPMNLETTGRRAFFVNQGGTVLSTDNAVQRYDGFAGGPVGSAALDPNTPAGSILGVFNSGVVAQDGGIWTVSQ